MKTKIIIGMALLMMASLVNAQDKGEIVIPLSNPGSKGSLYVSIRRGDIKVTGTDRKDILIKYQSLESKQDCESCDNNNGLKRISSGAIDLEAGENNNEVRISSDSYNKGVSLIIEMPKNMDLDLNGYNGGDITVNNVIGEHSLENYNGDIYAKGISGSVSANTYNGEIIVELLKVTAGVPMAFNTYNGDVDITFPSTMKGSFKLKTSRGEILSGFDMAITKSEPVKKTDSKSGTYKVYLDDWVRGDINGGGPEIVMKTYNDDIYIRRK